MRNASGNLGQKNMYDISFIKRVTRKFLDVSRYKKSGLHVQSCCCCFFLLIRPIVVFSPFRCLRRLGLFQTSCYCRAKLARLQLDCSTTLARLGFRRRI